MLEGTLGDFSLPDIFQLITLTKKSGALTVESGSQQGRVLFKGGEVSFAVADVQRVALGARLFAAGLVGEEQITRVLERKRSEGGDVLAMLVEEAVLDEDALDAFVREQIEDAVFELMRLDAAGFSFDAAVEEDDAVGLTVATEHLIMEGGRRMGEWSSIREHVPSADTVLGLASAPPTEGETVSVGVDEWRLLALVDGRRMVRDVVDLTGKGDFATSKLLADLVARGFLQVVQGDDEAGSGLAGMVARRDLLRRLEEMELGAPVQREPAGSSVPEAPPAPGEPADTLLAVADPPPAEQGAEEPADPFDRGADPHPATEPEQAGDDQPLVARPSGDMDRSQVARELASLGLGDDVPRPQAKVNGSVNGAEHPEGEAEQLRPLTRDEDVNKGLLLRLIDGVKGA